MSVERAATSLRIWAHGDLPAATACAISLGFERDRVLWQLRKPLGDDIAEPVMPHGVRLRAFVPGRDEEALLAINNTAFADHPEQGRWTPADVTTRQQQDWFDPAGLLLAERESDAALLGFHWTKVHRHADEAVGEVYVLAVSPAAQGLGLGAALTAAGLRHLRGLGLSQVMLYVDESNTAAMRLYRKAGFTGYRTDVQYRLDL